VLKNETRPYASGGHRTAACQFGHRAPVRGTASVLWTTFITFELYLAIAFGSVTHRDLFLETPIKLPILNVELPLVGFFVVAPTILVIFHFYILLQLLALAEKTKDYDALLGYETSSPLYRRYIRQRLDSFLVLQSLAGPSNQRALRFMGWITLVAMPVLVLLQAHVTFLPYHLEWIAWFLRIAVLIDLAIIWWFWTRIRSDEQAVARVPRLVWLTLGGLASLCVLFFGVGVATFPGEWADTNLPSFRIVPWLYFDPDFPLGTVPAPPGIGDRGGPFRAPTWHIRRASLHPLLFGGSPDEVTKRPRSLFSNRLVLADQSFVDPDKLDKVDVSRSFRGRDLRGAVLSGADLLKADFSGAMLNGVNFAFARLQSTRFDCAVPGFGSDPVPHAGQRVESRRWPESSCTWLQGTHFHAAQLQGASLFGALLQGAELDQAELQGAVLGGARLQGATLNGASLQGAFLVVAQLQGASLERAVLQGAYLLAAQLQGANLNHANLKGASLAFAAVWHAQGRPLLDLTDVDRYDPNKKPWETRPGETFVTWRDRNRGLPPGTLRYRLTEDRLLAVDPAWEPHDVIRPDFWAAAHKAPPQGEERRKKLAAFLAQLGCSSEAAPHLARSLIRFGAVPGGSYISLGRIIDTRSQYLIVANALRKGKSDPIACPGVKGFSDEDWARLDRLVELFANQDWRAVDEFMTSPVHSNWD